MTVSTKARKNREVSSDFQKSKFGYISRRQVKSKITVAKVGFKIFHMLYDVASGVLQTMYENQTCLLLFRFSRKIRKSKINVSKFICCSPFRNVV